MAVSLESDSCLCCLGHQFDELLALCLRSEDELFHVTLYSWMITEPVNLADRLVQVGAVTYAVIWLLSMHVS